MTELEKYVLNSVGQMTAALAIAKNNAILATKPDNENLLLSFLDTGVLKVLIACGIINTQTDDLSDDRTELVPQEQWQALVYWVMGEWLWTIGEPALGTEYLRRSGLPLDESQYRFRPGFPAAMKRPYNMLG